MGAINEYQTAASELATFSEEAGFKVRILTDEYPVQVHFTSDNSQTSIFDGESDGAETGEFIIVKCSIKPVINIVLDGDMDAATLKKLISKAEAVGALYYHAYREATQDADKVLGDAINAAGPAINREALKKQLGEVKDFFGQTLFK